MWSTKHFIGGLMFVLPAIGVGFIAPVSVNAAQDGTAGPPKIVRKSGGVLQGSAIRRVEPAYPPLAKAARISGSVVVEVTVDEEGNVFAARAISGHPLLKDVAVEAARGWQFAPTSLSGVRVKVIGTLTFNFHFDYSKDIEAVKEQLAAEPNAPQLHEKLARLYNADRQHEKAIKEYNRALKLGGDSAEVLFGLGEAYQAAGRFGEATDAYKRALRINPPVELAETINLRLGESYLKQNDNENALESFKQAVAANPASSAAHFQLGLTYLKLGDKQSAMNEYTTLKGLNSMEAELLRRSLERNN